MRSKSVSARLGIFLALLAMFMIVSAGDVSAQSFGGFWSAATLQNIGAGTASVDVEVYSNVNSDTETIATFQIEKGKGQSILPDSIAGSGPGIKDIDSGSAVVSSGEPLVAIVGLTNAPIADAGLGIAGGTSGGVYEGSGQNEIAPKLLFPIAKLNYFGQSTVYYVQNAGSQTANVTATFNWINNATTSTNLTIDPNRSVAISAPANSPSGNTNGLGSAVVESTNGQDLAGAVFEMDLGVPSKSHKTGRAFSTNDLQNEIYVPSYKKNYYGNISNIGIQSPDGSVSGTIAYTCSDSQPGGCTKGQTFNVSFTTPGAGKTYNAWPEASDHSALPNNSLYSAKITINNGTAVANLGEGGPGVESLYSGAGAQQAARIWACPIHKENYFGASGGTVIQPLEYPAKVKVTFAVNSSENGQFINQSYTFDNLNIPSGSAVLYEVAQGVSPAGVANLWVGTALPNSTGTSNTLTIESDKDVIVVSNEESHYSVPADQKLDGRQYNCFPIPSN